ncbi:uncharacterized protein BP5553_08378 [Venustampulla echinocandica]|uniref:Uncharacterized protein n=1 Tax=Venustampulla echinocandica TaxID=2656787 RepID=A0A370TE14_9HELO|nr:uncharacterized protein BP5553_08378 [Venustampulla echinocandica]RDL32939.1 hypothetical protein BP5553_08378 [Venustampulla echinocandica]
MARLKAQVVTASESPEILHAAPAVNPNQVMENSSPSISSATSHTCPHCNSAFSDMALQDFNHHVASCRPEMVSDSSLSPPTEPNSPTVVYRYLKSLNAGTSGQNKFGVINGISVTGANATGALENDEEVDDGNDRLIRPYVDPKAAFDYYDRLGEREASVATAKNSQEPEDPKNGINGNRASSSEEKSEAPNRFPFPKFTPIEDFEQFLAAPEDMPYEVLYLRTDGVASVMADYQKEWDVIGKEIYAHESYVKAQAKDLAEQAKELEEEKAKVEDQKYLQIAEDFKAQLRLSRSDWDKFLEAFEKDHPKETDLLERLRSLRLPNFLAGVNKRQKAREPEPIKLADRPLTAERVTKEELNMDKRKRGRLIDPITFDDMKHADAYGFNYSSQPHHVGNQPQPTFKGDVKTRGEAEDEGRSRSRRNKAQKNYDADKSVTPETESDELPPKRIRKPRINPDVPVEVQPRPKTAPPSRSATPAVRTFPSGKRIGRPPTKSKLKDVQVPPPAAAAAPIVESEAAPRKLAPKQEVQLQHAAKSLVKKTHPAATQSTDVDTTQTTSVESSRPTTSSSTESKKRKRGADKPEPDTVIVDAPRNEPGPFRPPPAPVAPAPATTAAGRKRKAKEEEVDESTLDPEALEKLRKRKIKSAKLSESLRKRWQSGDMAGAMETRKATNAAKKAAKEAAAVGTASGSVPPAAPAIAPTPPAPKAIQPQPAALAMVATETPAPKRKQSNSKPATSAKATGSGKGIKRAPAPTLPPVRKPSTRARRPTRNAMGMDGADDYDDDDDEEEDEELQQQFKSEYDHYQALTSPGSPILLGKRARKTKMDLQAELFDDADEMDESY